MRHIPNLLSLLRILLIPLFVWLMTGGRTLPAAIILGVSGFTDMLDGLLARRFGWITPLGKVLDPAADKLTQVTVSIVLAIYMHHFWPFFAVLLGKELVMLVLGGYLLGKGIRLEGARWFGKVATVLFYCIMVLLVFVPTLPHTAIYIGLTLVTLFTVLAAFLYLPEFFRYKRSK